MAVTILEEFDEGDLATDFDSGEATITRDVLIDGDQYQNFLNDLFGATFVSGWGFLYTKRATHPTYTWLTARSATLVGSAVPKDPPHDSTRYRTYARVKVVYKGSLLQFNIDPNDPTPPSGTYLSHTKQSSAEMMTIPEAGVKWSDGAMVANVDPAIVLPVTTHTFTWHGVTNPPWSAIDNAEGTLNSKDQFGWKQETCLFLNASEEQTYDVNGTVQYVLTYTFAERKKKAPDGTAVTWQHWYRGDTDNTAAEKPWDRLKDQHSVNLYNVYDFALLFKPGP